MNKKIFLMDETLVIKPFKKFIVYHDKRYLASFTQVELTKTKEVFTITVKGRSVQVYSDRPFIQQLPNSRKKPVFKAVNGRPDQAEFFTVAITAIEEHLKQLAYRPFDYRDHPKNAGMNGNKD